MYILKMRDFTEGLKKGILGKSRVAGYETFTGLQRFLYAPRVVGTGPVPRLKCTKTEDRNSTG